MIFRNLKNLFTKECTEIEKKVSLYEISYEQSRISRPEKNLPSLEDLKKEGLSIDEYAAKLDKLAHMKPSIDAAYEAAQKIMSDRASKDMSPEEIYFKVGCAVHDTWCVENKGKYRDPARADRQWQFLSGPAIGWSEFEKDMKYVSIVLSETYKLPAFSEIKDDIENFYEKENFKHGADPQYELSRWARLSGLPCREDSWWDYETPVAMDDKTEKIVADLVGSPYGITEVHGDVYLEKNGTDPTGQKVGTSKIIDLFGEVAEIEKANQRKEIGE